MQYHFSQITLTEEVGQTLTETEVTETVYAGNLTAAYLGPDITLSYIHQYRYSGEDREKIRRVWDIKRIEQIYSDGRVRTKVYGHVDSNYYYEWTTLPATTEVIVTRGAKK